MKKILYFGLLFSLFISACETVVEVDIPRESPKIVVNSFIQPGNPVRVLLSQSQFVLSNRSLRNLPGAAVRLLEDGSPVATLEELELENDGTVVIDDLSQTVYFTDFTPTVGREYTIQVDKAGFDPVEATTFIKSAVPIQDLQYDTTVYEYSYFDGNTTIIQKQINLSDVQLSITDPGAENNYYEITVAQYVTQYRGAYNEEDGTYTITDTVTVLAPMYLNSDDPIVNEGDFFTGDDRYYGSSLIFPDEIFNGKSYTVRFNVETYSYSEEPVKEYIVFLRSLDEAQYLYIRSTDLQSDTEGNPFAEPVPVYNNIENGYGIFASSSSDTVNILLEE